MNTVTTGLAGLALGLVVSITPAMAEDNGRPILPVPACQLATGVRPSVGVHVRRLERQIRCLERRLERRDATIVRLRARLGQ
jgi:hypothetical protein